MAMQVEDAVKAMKEEAKDLGWELLEYKKANGDDFLYYTLCSRNNKYVEGGKDYCTHIFNSSLGGFHLGNYDFPTKEFAMKDLEWRFSKNA